MLHRIFYIHIKVEYTAAQLIHRSPRPFNSIELFERSSIIWRNFRCRRRVASQFSLWRDYKRPVLTLVPAKCSFRYLRRRKILEPASIPTRVKTARCKPINRKGARSACITPPLRWNCSSISPPLTTCHFFSSLPALVHARGNILFRRAQHLRLREPPPLTSFLPSFFFFFLTTSPL